MQPAESTAPRMCKCGRPRFTTADLEQWRREFPDGNPAPDPPWAADICWFNGPGDCGRRPLIKTTPT